MSVEMDGPAMYAEQAEAEHAEYVRLAAKYGDPSGATSRRIAQLADRVRELLAEVDALKVELAAVAGVTRAEAAAGIVAAIAAADASVSDHLRASEAWQGVAKAAESVRTAFGAAAEVDAGGAVWAVDAAGVAHVQRFSDEPSEYAMAYAATVMAGQKLLTEVAERDARIEALVAECHGLTNRLAEATSKADAFEAGVRGLQAGREEMRAAFVEELAEVTQDAADARKREERALAEVEEAHGAVVALARLVVSRMERRT